jgi:uncharacterized alkaline shock family protein YloU
MKEETRPQGKTTIAPDVLISIAKLTALGVPGVYGLVDAPTDVKRLFSSHKQDGVQITVENNTVYADIYVVVNDDVNVKDVSHKIQGNVGRAISEMVGMEVGKINIHIEDIHFGEDQA